MSNRAILELLSSFQEYTIVACCLLCFLFFSQLSEELKVLSYYLFFMLVINSLAVRMANLRLNNMPTTHLLVLGEFLFLSIFFKTLLQEQLFFRKYFKVYLAVIGGLVIGNTLFIEPISVFNTNAKVLVLFVVITFAVLFFYERSKEVMTLTPSEKAIRIVNSALLLYYSGSFFVFLFYKFTQNNKQFYSSEMLIFNASLYLLFTALILVAIVIVVMPHLKRKT